jgi:hypothetical protein
MTVVKKRGVYLTAVCPIFKKLPLVFTFLAAVPHIMSWIQPEVMYGAMGNRRAMRSVPQQMEMMGMPRRQRMMMGNSGAMMQGATFIESPMDQQVYFDMPMSMSPPPMITRAVRPQVRVVPQFTAVSAPVSSGIIQQHQVINMQMDRKGRAPPGSIKGPQQVVVPKSGQVDKMQYVYPHGQGLVRLPGGQVMSGRVSSKQQDGMMHEMGRSQPQVN